MSEPDTETAETQDTDEPELTRPERKRRVFDLHILPGLKEGDRIIAALEAEGVTSVAQLKAIVAEKGEQGLLQIKGIGAKGAETLMTGLKQLNPPEKPDQATKDGKAPPEKGVASAVLDASKRLKTDKKVAPLTRKDLKQPNEFSGQIEGYGNQQFQVGSLMDMWSDVLPAAVDKTEDFWHHFAYQLEIRTLWKLFIFWDSLQATGLKAPNQRMLFIRRGEVTITVYFARQGIDLYLSWRAFIQTKISEIKVAVYAAIAVLAGIVAGLIGNAFAPLTLVVSGQTYITQDQLDGARATSTAFAFIVVVLAVAGWIAIRGFLRYDGDYFGMLRSSTNELQIDNMMALTEAVHNSLLGAAEGIDIDTAKLEAKEPFYKTRRKPRI